ncbi:alpha/beta hydrolase [Methanococcoides sp. SA1]|nr:alpha/beta hydrolase [Methanococcoides sp. SA1]
MKQKINIILILMLIALAFSGCIGTEVKNPTQEYSKFSIIEVPVKYAEVNGIEIGYREFGSGEPLLIIMPFASTMDMCNATFVEHLASSYRVILFDNRGMGYSSDNNGTISISILVNDTSGLINELELNSTHVFGSSMGSVIAQELALEHPEKIDKLIHSSATYSLNVPQTEILRSRLQYRTSDPDTDPVLRKYAEGNLKWNGTYERLPEFQNKMLLHTGFDISSHNSMSCSGYQYKCAHADVLFIDRHGNYYVCQRCSQCPQLKH